MNRPKLLHRRTVRWLAVMLIAFGVVLLLWLKGPNWSQVGQAFTNVSWQWVLVALLLNILSVLTRVLCWWTILRPALAMPGLRYLDALSAFAAGLIANAVLPGRGGEIARVAVLHHKLEARPGLWPTLIGTVIAYRLLDVVPVVVLAVWVIFTAPLPSWAFTSLITVVAIGAALFLAGVALAHRVNPRRPVRLGPLRRAAVYTEQGLAALNSLRTGAQAAALQLLGWFIQLLAVWTAMRAFQIYLPLSAAGLVLVLMNIALLLPLWTGNIGLLQAAIALPLIGYGVSYAQGFAYGIGLQAIEASVGIGFGLGFLAKEGIGLATLREARRAAARESPAGHSPARRVGVRHFPRS